MKPECGFWKWLWLTVTGNRCCRDCYFCLKRWSWPDPCLGFCVQGFKEIFCPIHGELVEMEEDA